MNVTENLYLLPLDMKYVDYTKSDGPGHPGQFATAIDFAVPIGTDVMAPLDGDVITVVDQYTEYGDSPKFSGKANYIQIKHKNGEISDLMHLEQGSILVRVGERVKEGQPLARTGLSGFMTAPHLHWFVYKLSDNKDGFEGLKIRIREESMG